MCMNLSENVSKDRRKDGLVLKDRSKKIYLFKDFRKEIDLFKDCRKEIYLFKDCRKENYLFKSKAVGNMFSFQSTGMTLGRNQILFPPPQYFPFQRLHERHFSS